MATTALRPRSATELVDASFQVLRAHYLAFITCTAIAYLPLLLVRLLVVGDPRGTINDPTQFGSTATKYVIMMVVSLATYVLISSVLVTVASQAYLGDPVDVVGAVRRVARRLPAVLVAAILSSLLIFVGLLLFLLPAVYFTARTFAVSTTLLLEDVSVGAAFHRSSELSKGRKRHILNTLGLAFLIYYVIVIGFTFIGTITGSFVLQTISSTAAVILIYPIVGIVSVLLYYDARIRSEGLDIQMMADELAPAPAGAMP